MEITASPICLGMLFPMQPECYLPRLPWEQTVTQLLVTRTDTQLAESRTDPSFLKSQEVGGHELWLTLRHNLHAFPMQPTTSTGWCLAQKLCWAYLKVIFLHTRGDTSYLLHILREGRQSAVQQADQSSICPAPISSWNTALWLVSSCQQNQILFALYCKAFPTPLGQMLFLLSPLLHAPADCHPWDPNIHHIKTQHTTSNLSQCLCQGKCCLSSWLISLTN